MRRGVESASQQGGRMSKACRVTQAWMASIGPTLREFEVSSENDPFMMEKTWISVSRPLTAGGESLADRVRRIEADLGDINTFYSISISPTRYARLCRFYSDELESLAQITFERLDQQDKVDYILLRKYLERGARQLQAKHDDLAVMKPLLTFADTIISICEARERVKPVDYERAAQQLDDVKITIDRLKQDIDDGKIRMSKTNAFRASKIVSELRGHLGEYFSFYVSYDPQFDWWMTTPWQASDQALEQLIALIRAKLAGVRPDGGGDIIGEPIGREGLLRELEAEVVAYSPEELIKIADEQMRWCEEQMKAASRKLGYGDDWKKAMNEDVKTRYVSPGDQPRLVIELAREGARYVREHDLVTVPTLAEETYRMTMMSAERQKIAPFFLGGPSIQVAYPTTDMAQATKLMVMRSNNRHFARATAFHELIPGHRLQLFMMERHRSHRQLFTTPFLVEGWAMYWEMVLWRRGDFFVSPRDRIGTLFWRMHRCARITLSLGFHMGSMTPAECIDMLVDVVGHERSTAEGEVRRWLNGDYGPLYQVAYMTGALQMLALRDEALGDGRVREKEFHDLVLTLGAIPVELIRALVLDTELRPDYKASWKFYKFQGEKPMGSYLFW
ncbi:hypothetical protein HIM_01148 [Hirsutella minnesotensis 3608]|nr:hypothetical protein HIM_01148 [Hirsutella minnesotensis 3608]